MPIFFAQSLDDMATREDLISRSGLAFLQAILAGDVSAAIMGQTLNFGLTAVEDGKVTFEGSAELSATNPMRGVHGGWYGALLDSVMGCAVMTKLPKGRVYTTLEYKINITRALPLGRGVIATGTIDHAGRTTAVAHGEIRGRDDDVLYATGSTTCLIMDGAP